MKGESLNFYHCTSPDLRLQSQDKMGRIVWWLYLANLKNKLLLFMACQKRLVMLQRLIHYLFCPQVYLSVHLHSAELSAPAAGSARTGRQWLHEGRWRGNSLLIPSSEDGEKGEWFCLFVINVKMITSQSPESWNYVPYECDGCCHNATIPE